MTGAKEYVLAHLRLAREQIENWSEQQLETYRKDEAILHLKEAERHVNNYEESEKV